MNLIPIDQLSSDPANARVAPDQVPADILMRRDGQEVTIVSGNLRATAMADLGRLVPAVDTSGEHVVLKRDAEGCWALAIQRDIDQEMTQNRMRVGRKVNAGPVAQPGKPAPYYRRFSKSKY